MKRLVDKALALLRVKVVNSKKVLSIRYKVLGSKIK